MYIVSEHSTILLHTVFVDTSGRLGAMLNHFPSSTICSTALPLNYMISISMRSLKGRISAPNETPKNIWAVLILTEVTTLRYNLQSAKSIFRRFSGRVRLRWFNSFSVEWSINCLRNLRSSEWVDYMSGERLVGT